ncbi:MAG: MlaD family protein [Acidaminococcaceae bacterium]|jgi:phospholipid/cholesterol/gamma-HCH transport system substrate-binding protein|nr:MlaD family protein [Acidaminococcaceae bacterium]
MNPSEVKVGAMTLGGALVLALIVSFLGAFSIFDRGYNLEISYPSVSGLKVGNEVRYAGVPVGSVKDIKVLPNRILVTAAMNKGVQIPQGSVFSLGADGILGDKFVDIVAPEKVSGNFIPKDSAVTGTTAKGLDEFMASSSKVLAKMEGIADALNNVFGDPEVQKSMRDGFINAKAIGENLTRLTGSMADIADANKGEINQMVSNMSAMTIRMNGVAAHLESIVSTADANGATGANIAEMARNLADTSRKVQEVSTVLKNVATDPKTAKDIQSTIHNASEASARANRVLKVLNDPHVRIDELHSAKGGTWRTNLGVSLEPTEDTALYVGGASVGDDNKLDLQLIKKRNAWDFSAGAMQGKFGIGVGYDLGKRFRIYSQLYDFNDAKVRVGGEYKLNSNLSLVGESLDIRNGDGHDVYLGMRAYF